MIRLLLAALLAAIVAAGAPASAQRGYTYNLVADEIAPGVHVFWGLQEGMNRANGANIVNTGFIVGDDAVLVIDTGPTRIYGEEMIAAIRAVAGDRPIRLAVVTHHHFDHAFGLGVFKRANVPVLMHRAARDLLLRDGPEVLEFMEILVGTSWLTRLRVERPTRVTHRTETIDLGNRPVTILPFEDGHTGGDLVVYDEATGTLFSGDLVFVGRAPTIPHADIRTWLGHLDRLAEMPWQRLVPGHGPLVADPAAFDEMRNYLVYLDDYARAAVDRGDSLADILEVELPERFRGLAEVEIEFERSMLKLYREYEAEALDTAM